MQKVIFISGISSGFGKAMALELSRQGHSVYGSSRKPDFSLEGVHVLKMDVTLIDEVEQAIQKVMDLEGKIDVLINNSGFGLAGALEDFSEDEAHRELNTNLLGSYRCSKCVLPHMRKRGEGMIISISSIAGLLGIPFQGFYSASKFGLEGFMQSLRYEVMPLGIKVVMINPGDFRTSFTAHRLMVKKASESDYFARFKTTLDIVERDEGGGLKATKLAKKVAGIVNKKNPRHRYVVASLSQKLAVFLNIILPPKWFYKILSSHYRTR